MPRLPFICVTLAALTGASAIEARTSSRFSALRARVVQARQFERTMRSLQRWPASQVVLELDRLRGGEPRRRWKERDLEDRLQRAKLSTAGLAMALERAFRQGFRPRLKQALGQYARGGITPSVNLDPKSAELMGLIEGSRVHAATGRGDLQRRALARANKLAKVYGVSIEEALGAGKASYQISASRRGAPNHSPGLRFRRSHFRSGQGGSLWRLRPGDSRRAGSHRYWWTGYQSAYLDLMYRRLPELLEASYRKSPHKRAFRIWHAGSEEGSQTFMLAALVDGTVARLRRRRPEMRGFLDRLKVEIVATDLSIKLKQRGRTVRFMADGPPVHTKNGLVAEELGWSERRAARREVRKLEKELAVSGGAPRAAVLQKLADAGKVGLLMNRLLTLAPRVDLDQGQTPVFNYSVRRRGWRVENRPAGQPVLNPHATRRRIRFELSDLTRGRPRGKFDLTVCTNVLPWFGHYERNRSFGLVHQDENIRRGLSNLSASLRPGGALLLDERSEQTIHRTAPGTLASFASARKAIWVTRPSSVEPMHKPEDG